MYYIPETLYKNIRNYKKNKTAFPNILLKIYGYQMLRGLAYLEGIGICHRNIKPQNIVVNADNRVLKICDFGSAKRLMPGEPNLAYNCSRYYTASKLIFGATEYTTSIDVWSQDVSLLRCVVNLYFLDNQLLTNLFRLSKYWVCFNKIGQVIVLLLLIKLNK